MAYRLSKAQYRSETMSGVGAHAAGGRWNSPGHYVVYSSGNLSLAMLELLVHVDDAEEARELPLVYHSLSFSTEYLAVLTKDDLPSGWDSRPESTVSRIIGDEWLERLTSVVLAVPSVVTPEPHRFVALYMNYLINPRHPDFDEVVAVDEVLDLDLDSRLG